MSGSGDTVNIDGDLVNFNGHMVNIDGDIDKLTPVWILGSLSLTWFNFNPTLEK